MVNDQEFREQVLQRLARLEVKVDTLRGKIAVTSACIAAVLASAIGAVIGALL